MSRRAWLAGSLLGGVLLAGCSSSPQEPRADSPPPEVTFSAAGNTVEVRPTQYCQRGQDACRNDREATASMRVPAGEPLRISVPTEVADAPWVAVFRYRKASGKAGPPGRSKVFTAGSTRSYTLELPKPGDKLEEVQVQRIGAIAAGETADEGLDYVVDATWVLEVR